MESKVLNVDCMEYMRSLPDKFFDLAIADPPYGIGAGKMTMGSGKNHKFSKTKDWDANIPDATFFDELMRVSSNQIIWGGNYFTPPSRLLMTGLFGINSIRIYPLQRQNWHGVQSTER